MYVYKGEIPLPAFHLPNIATIKTCLMSSLLLRKASTFAKKSDTSTEAALKAHRV